MSKCDMLMQKIVYGSIAGSIAAALTIKAFVFGIDIFSAVLAIALIIYCVWRYKAYS